MKKLLALSLIAIAFAGLAVSSSAFTTGHIERTAEVKVAQDSSGYVEIQALNNNYADIVDGSLKLNFDDDAGLGIFDEDAEGLNPNSEYHFEEVFRISNIAGLGDMRVFIEKDGFGDQVNVTLTADGDEAIDIDPGTSLMVEDYDDVDNLPKLVQPDAVDVDITIETGEDLGDYEGSLIIHAATEGNRDKLSSVLSE